MKPHRTPRANTGSKVKITEVNNSFETKNRPRITIAKANLLADDDRFILYGKYQHFRDDIETHDSIHLTIAIRASPFRITALKPFL
jgi:hypothetical protein